MGLQTLNNIEMTVKISLDAFQRKIPSEGYVEQLELQSCMSGVEMFLLPFFPV